jgi:hypothetical protein
VRLRELEPTFLRIESEGHYQMVDELPADGVQFLCPVCFHTNNGPIGTHSIICWAPHVPQTEPPIPGRWELVGTSYDDLTLRAGSSSVLLQTAPCKAHFFVRNGEIVSC